MQATVSPSARKLVIQARSAKTNLPKPSYRSNRPHVLLICYDYPCNYAAGVIRTYQFAKELLGFGWQPVILTAQGFGQSEYNIERSNGMLECETVSAPEIRFSNYSGTPQTPGSQSELEEQSLTRRFHRFGSGLALPDGKLGWLYPAVRRARKIMRAYPIRLCFSVSPRPTAHLVGFLLARSCKIAWVADFALPWSDAYWLTRRPRCIRYLDERLEGLVIRSANHITVAYPELARKLALHFCDTKAANIDVIPTGFDEDLFVRAKPTVSRKFTILYPGNHFLEAGRYGEYFLRAFDDWLDLEPGLDQRVEFVVMGKHDGELLRQQRCMTHSQVVHLEKMVPHSACIEKILSAQVCVVNTIGHRVPSKVYECMRAGKWILALTSPSSDLAAIVQGYPKAIVVSAQDTSAIAFALRSIWRRCHSDTVEEPHSKEYLGNWSARHSTVSLAAVFDQLLVNG